MRTTILFLLFGCTIVRAEPNAERIADAIYRAEGGSRARVPYGILSVTVRDHNDARQICLRTIRNAWTDYRIDFPNDAGGERFIDYLANRYCPPSVDRTGNLNWKRNVKALLK